MKSTEMDLYTMTIEEFVDTSSKGGSLKRSLGMVSLAFAIPRAFGFEAATQCTATTCKFVPNRLSMAF
jgi:hypothetical protein